MHDIDSLNLDKYIQELEENKNKLKNLVSKLENIANNIDEIIPKKYDYKSRYIMTDRVQTLTTLYESILRYRSEISKHIKEQATLEKTSLTLDTEDDPESVKKAVINMSMDELKKIFSESK